MKFISGMEISDYAVILDLELDAKHFSSEWLHCDQIANFLGKVLGQEKDDSFRYGNLVSTIANEMLESLYYQNSGSGTMVIEVIKKSPWLGFSIHIPASPENIAFYKSFYEQIPTRDIKDYYMQVLSDKENPEPGSLGLLELLANYNAHIALNFPDKQTASLAFMIDVESVFAG